MSAQPPSRGLIGHGQSAAPTYTCQVQVYLYLVQVCLYQVFPGTGLPVSGYYLVPGIR